MPVIPVVLPILKPATCYLCRNIKASVVAKVENMGTHHGTFLIHVSFKVHMIDVFIIFIYTTISMTFGILRFRLSLEVSDIQVDVELAVVHPAGQCTTQVSLNFPLLIPGLDHNRSLSSPVPVRLTRSQFDHILYVRMCPKHRDFILLQVSKDLPAALTCLITTTVSRVLIGVYL